LPLFGVLRARLPADFRLTDAMWENFALPINPAFFFYNTPQKKMTALYPEPGESHGIAPPLSA
jgi:hypothetical protein